MAGRQLSIQQNKQSASYEAGATLASIVQSLQVSFTPLLALREKIVTNPSFPALKADWNRTTARLLSSFNENMSLVSLQLAPFGVIELVEPFSLLGPSQGLSLLSEYPDGTYAQMASGELGWDGPVFIHQGNWSMLASLPIFVASNFTNSQKPDPAWGGPPTNSTCDISECDGSMGKWWGTIYAAVLIDSLLQQPTMVSLQSQGWIVKLSRLLPQGSSDPDPVVFSMGDGQALIDPVSVALDLGRGHGPEQPQLLLQLSLSPSSGSWTGDWWIGALIGVIVLGLCTSILLFLHLLRSVQLSWLLHAMIPPSVVRHLQRGETFAVLHDSCILFCDVVGFTSLTREMDPRDVARLVDDLTGIWEEAAIKEGLLRIDVIGDSFMAGAGCLKDIDPSESALRTARVALAIIESTQGLVTPDGSAVQVRVGIHAGPCVTAVVGSRCPKLSVFSDVVNVASRMESSSLPGCVQISDVVAKRLCSRDLHECGVEVSKRGTVQLKNRGEMETFWLFEAGGFIKKGNSSGQDAPDTLPSTPPSVDIQLDHFAFSSLPHPANSVAGDRLSSQIYPVEAVLSDTMRIPSTLPPRVSSRTSDPLPYWVKERRSSFLKRNVDTLNEKPVAAQQVKLDEVVAATGDK